MEWTYYLPIGLFQAVITAIVWYFASYAKEKGKNLATKEDIHEITRQIESAKIDYAKELEGLKSQLNAKFHAHTVRFEREFECYREIWRNLIEFWDAFAKYRIQANLSASESAQFKSELSGKFVAAANHLISAYEKNRPFFSQSVYEVISKITNNPSIQNLVIYDLSKRPKYDDDLSDRQERMNRALDDIEEIKNFMEPVREAICRRIERLDDSTTNP